MAENQQSFQQHLNFEQPIIALESKIEELKRLADDGDEHRNIHSEIERLSKKCSKLKETIYKSLSAWQISQIARHPQRPHTLDFINELCTDFEELHGDRQYTDDKAIVTGIARFDGTPVVIVGHQKGSNTEEKVLRNFGMPRPEGYRKALRIFKMAEQFNLPILTFIDTPGAYPGIGAEERGQSRAIAENLQVMSRLKTPIISTVIGEGGSGGALAIGVCDNLFMLQYSIYSVISPEGCASILWKRSDKAQTAAEIMGITSERLYELGLIDQIVPEPVGGAHRDLYSLCESFKKVLAEKLAILSGMEVTELLQRRQEKLTNIGNIQTWTRQG